MKNYAGAEKLYLELLSTDGGNVPSVRAHAAAGRYYARRDQPDLAVAQGLLIEAVDSTNSTAIFLRGVGELAKGDYSSAQKDITDASTADPQAQYWEALGRVMEKQNDLALAQANYEHAAQIDARYAAPQVGLGRVHMARREFGAALESLAKAAVIDPEDATVWATEGEALYSLGKLPDSEAAYGKALRLDARNARAWYMLGKAYKDESKMGEAISALHNATTLAAHGTEWLPDAYQQLGFTYRQMGSRSAMYEAFRRFIEGRAAERAAHHQQVRSEAASCN